MTCRYFRQKLIFARAAKDAVDMGNLAQMLARVTTRRLTSAKAWSRRSATNIIRRPADR